MIILFLVLSIGISKADEKEGQIDSLLHKKSTDVQIKILDSILNNNNFQNSIEGIKMAKKYANLVKNSTDSVQIGKAHLRIGWYYFKVGELDKSLKNLFLAKSVFQRSENIDLLGNVYNSIGTVYCDQENQEYISKGISYFLEFLKLSQSNGDSASVAGAFSNIGWAYNNLEKNDSALVFHKKALKMRLLLKKKLDIAISYHNIAYTYSLQGKYDKAIYYFHKSKPYIQEANNHYGKYISCFDMANMFIHMKELDSAKYYAFQADSLSKILKSKVIFQEVNQTLSMYFHAVHNDQKAYEHLLLSKAYNDSIVTEKMKNKLAEMQTLYELEKKEQHIHSLKEKNKYKEWLIIIISVAGLLIILSIIFLLSQVSAKRKKEKELHLKREELAKEKLEKSRLKESELEVSLKNKSKQLSTHALHMMQKNTMLQEILKQIKLLSKKIDNTDKQELRQLTLSLNQSLRSDKDWDVFKLYFEEINKTFYKKLKDINSDLTANDHRLCALIKLNMNSKEMASVLNLAPSSIKSSRHRLKKKLNLGADVDMEAFIRSLE